ncbi:hypothetical protein ILUMI_16731, partial [Ignelater luminosus]
GHPSKFISDNEPYNSHKFIKFCKVHEIQCIFSSPKHSKGNGLAEKAVHICKQMLKKSGKEENIFYYLLEYRTTPLCGFNVSPSELLNSRLLITKLLISNALLKPKVVDIKNGKLEKQNAVKQLYDATARTKPTFHTNGKVVFKTNRNDNWRQGRNVGKHETSRSYIVKDSNGIQYRRNSYLIKHSSSPPQDTREKISKKPTDIEQIKHSISENSIEQNQECENNHENQEQMGNATKARPQRTAVKPVKFNDYILM